MNIREIIYNYSYDLVAVIMSWKAMKASNWAAVLPFPQPNGFFKILRVRRCLCFPLLEIFAILCVLSSNKCDNMYWLLFRGHVRLQLGLLPVPLFSHSLVTSSLSSAHASSTSTWSSFFAPSVLRSCAAEPVSVASTNISVVPTHLLNVLSAATVAAAWQVQLHSQFWQVLQGMRPLR